jgi:hypothetical protein
MQSQWKLNVKIFFYALDISCSWIKLQCLSLWYCMSSLLEFSTQTISQSPTSLAYSVSLQYTRWPH